MSTDTEIPYYGTLSNIEDCLRVFTIGYYLFAAEPTPKNWHNQMAYQERLRIFKSSYDYLRSLTSSYEVLGIGTVDKE